METITLDEYLGRLKAQGVPREHVASRCVVCGTVQSMQSFILAGVSVDETETRYGFSCVGRHTGAGPYDPKRPAGRGCDWTLGGLFRIHKLEVISQDGIRHPRFEPASPEEARELMERNLSRSMEVAP